MLTIGITLATGQPTVRGSIPGATLTAALLAAPQIGIVWKTASTAARS